MKILVFLLVWLFSFCNPIFAEVKTASAGSCLNWTNLTERHKSADKHRASIGITFNVDTEYCFNNAFAMEVKGEGHNVDVYFKKVNKF